MGIKEWFDAHEDWRLVFKYAVYFGVGFGLAYGSAAVAKGLVPESYIPYIVLVLALVGEKYKFLDPSKPWPVVGAGRKRRR